MNAKMTGSDAAKCLGVKAPWIQQKLIQQGLVFTKNQNTLSFGHLTARALFNFNFSPMVVVFQIVKGGTGKTSIAHEFAVRSSLYGARVLCIDLDQQGNLTHAFNAIADLQPVMVDILAEGYAVNDAIITVAPGIDLLASRIENALLNEVIRLKNIDLKDVYRDMIKDLRKDYDLIVIDCPPNLDQSVAAAALAADVVISPVVPERFALEGLRMTCESICELQSTYNIEIPFGIVLNKFDTRTILAQETLDILHRFPLYEGKVLNTVVRMSQEFPNAIARGQSIFDATKPSSAKTDMDNLTQELLGIEALLAQKTSGKKNKVMESFDF